MSEVKDTKKMIFSKQFLVFVIIGGINTLSSMVFSAIYAYMLGDVVAFLPGYLTGILVAYTLNTIINFKQPFKFIKLIKYGISTIPNFIIQFICVYICVELLKINSIIAYGLAAIIGVPVTYVIVKLFVFKKK